MKKPNAKKKLYHYTSINNLALILQSKSIRFGRLDQVNDPTEGAAEDFHSLSPYIFISCWTENNEENLALWNMYTPNMKGVRIEIETPIFESYYFNSIKNLLFKEDDYLNESSGYFILGGQNEPYKIEYTDDVSLLKPSIRTDIGLDIHRLAKYKRKIWIVEQEYRYRLDILPIDKHIESGNIPDRYEHLIERQEPPPIDEYFVKIKDEPFHGMKILCSPKLQNGDREIIEALVKTFNENARIHESKLKGLIK
ncbi:hypothetical protein ACFLSY_10145 [Bacteroidota bacterium]